MKKKICISIDIDFFKEVRIFCAQNDIKISKLFEIAVKEYIAKSNKSES